MGTKRTTYLDPKYAKYDEESTADDDDVSDWLERRHQSFNYQFESRGPADHPENIAEGFTLKSYTLLKMMNVLLCSSSCVTEYKGTIEIKRKSRGQKIHKQMFELDTHSN